MVFHSIKGGTGKSTLIANLAVALALKGHRIGVIDFDLKGPSLNVIFDLTKDDLTWKINDFLMGKCQLKDCIVNLTDQLGIKKGELYFVPASPKIKDALKVLKIGYEVDPLVDNFIEIMENLKLALLLVDSHSGLDEDSLLAMAFCDFVVIVSKLDGQNYVGTNVGIKTANTLKKQILLIANKVPKGYDSKEVKTTFEKFYNRTVFGVVPYYPDVSEWDNSVFYLKNVFHPYSIEITNTAENLLENLASSLKSHYLRSKALY